MVVVITAPSTAALPARRRGTLQGEARFGGGGQQRRGAVALEAGERPRLAQQDAAEDAADGRGRFAASNKRPAAPIAQAAKATQSSWGELRAAAVAAL